MSRGVHRIIGTIVAVVVTSLMCWAIMSASGPDQSPRWITFQFLFSAFIFFGAVIQQIPGTGYAGLLLNVTLPLVSVAYFDDSYSHVPLAVPLTRIIFISIICVWCVLVYSLLVPIRSVNNLRMSLLNCLSTSGKAFTTLVACGLLHNQSTEGTSQTQPDATPLSTSSSSSPLSTKSTPTVTPTRSQLSESENKVFNESMSTLTTANALHKLLLMDTWFETLLQRYLYRDYAEAVDLTKDLIQKLILIQTLFDAGFDEAITSDLIAPLRPNINFVMVPISARVDNITEQRALFALRRKTSRATNITHLPRKIRELVKERQEHRQRSREAKRNKKASEQTDGGGFPYSLSGVAQINLSATDSTTIENEREWEYGVPLMKVPKSFADLQENFQQFRAHLYRTGSCQASPWDERAEYMRFYALLQAMGLFAKAWEDMRQTMLRLGLKDETTELLRSGFEEQIATPPASPPTLEVELATQTAAVGAKPQALAHSPHAHSLYQPPPQPAQPQRPQTHVADEVELQVMLPSEVQLYELQAQVHSQQLDEMSIMTQEDRGGAVA